MRAASQTSQDRIAPRLKGQRIVMDVSGALYLPQLSTLIFSDLHFEKGSSFARRGQMIPPFDTAATLEATERAMRVYRPRHVISLGDAFHDREAEQRMNADNAARLETICTSTDWHWVLGNHDPRPPLRFSGTSHQILELGDLVFVHEPGEAEGWTMAGHLHPCAVVSQDGCRLRSPCFLTDGERMILPAFGAFTGGLNILDKAYQPHFGADASVHVMGRAKVYQVPRAVLRPDASDWYTARKALR